MPTLNFAPRSLPPAITLQAVLWDMDGTLIDTEPYWLRAESALVGSFGGTWTPAQSLALVGSALPTAAAVLQAAGVCLPEREIIDYLTAQVVRGVREELIWRPGALQLLQELSAAGIPQALVTMSERNIVQDFTAQLPAGVFDVIVTGEDVTAGKPNPEPYLRAVGLLSEKFERQLDPAACVGFEDSLPGITSASSAGLHAVLIPNITDAGEGPWHRISSLEELTVSQIDTWLEQVTA